MVEGTPTPVINTSIPELALTKGPISVSVAAMIKICMAQISCLAFIFQDLEVTFAKIFQFNGLYHPNRTF